MNIRRRQLARFFLIGLLYGSVLGVFITIIYRRTQDLAIVIGISIVIGIISGLIVGLLSRRFKSPQK